VHLEIRPIPGLWLAAASAPQGDDASEVARPPANVGANPRVLIVEDEGLVALNMENALTEAGFRVVAVVDTEKDAIEAAQRLKPDVILMDIALREGDGISAATAILKTLPARMIFVSGNSDSQTLAAAGEIASCGFIRKPFITERLAGLVREAITPKN